MYDTLTLSLDNTMINPVVLTHSKEHVDLDTGVITNTGNLDNLFIKTCGDNLFINGSLAVYHLGNNFETLTRATTKEALVNLSDRLHIDISQANVYRMDIGQNLLMSKPVECYTSRLLEAPYLKRSPIANNQSIYFSSTNKTICIYDKIGEQKKKQKVIPDLFINKNVLRYENRFVKRLKAQFKVPEITAKKLTDEIFYMKALTKWHENWKLIKKVKKGEALNMENVKEFEKSLIYYGMETIGGYDVACSMLRNVSG